MTHFPQHSVKLPAAPPAGSPGTGRQTIIRDILWGQPLFKAPVLPNPRVALDPLPFTATRITDRSPSA